MKRTILILFSILGSAAALLAGDLKLECSKFFEGSYLTNPKAEVTVINDNGRDFYKYTVTKDEKTSREILEAVESDSKKTKNKTVRYEGGQLTTCILNFESSDGRTTLIYSPDVEEHEVTLSISTEL